MPLTSNSNPAAKLLDDCLCEIAAIKQVPRWQREAEARLASQLSGLIRQAERAALAEIARIGRTPSTDIQRRAVAQQLEMFSEDLQSATAEAAVNAARTAREIEAQRLVRLGREAVGATGLIRQVEQAIREKVFQATQGTMDRISGNVVEVLARGYADGKGIADITRDLREVFEGMADFELARVARTEIHGATTDATHATLLDYGVEYKQWVSAIDDRTRETHQDMNGQITRTDLAFSNGMMYPGDRNAEIEEWINCRCREVPYLMPRGFRPPTGRDWFYEKDIVKT